MLPLRILLLILILHILPNIAQAGDAFSGHPNRIIAANHKITVLDIENGQNSYLIPFTSTSTFSEPTSYSPMSRMFNIIQEKFSLQVGYKLWIAKWETPIPTATGLNAKGQPPLGEEKQTTTSDFEFFQGPTVNAVAFIGEEDSPWFRYLFVDFTWLNAGVYFPQTVINDGEENVPGLERVNRVNPSAIRTDLNFALGATIYKNVGIFVGYYHSKHRFSNQRNYSFFERATNTETPFASDIYRVNRTFKGPLVGVFGTSPIADQITLLNTNIAGQVSLYGNFAFSFLTLKQKGLQDGKENSVQGYSSEVGVSIQGPSIWKFGSSLQVGFRGQFITANFGKSGQGAVTALNDAKIESINDITWGPIFSFNLRF